MVELLACPNPDCGSAPVVEITCAAGGWQGFVQCNYCGTCGPLSAVYPVAMIGAKDAAKRVAAELWNTLPRSTPPLPEVEVERVARFWLIVHQPGLMPDRKGPWPQTQIRDVLRDFIKHNPTAYLHVLSVDESGEPDIEHGPMVLQSLDGRSMGVGRKHNARTEEAHRAAISACTGVPEGEACDICHGYGETFGHAPDCDNDSCALAGGIDDCNGQVDPCPRCAPPPTVPESNTPPCSPPHRREGSEMGLVVPIESVRRRLVAYAAEYQAAAERAPRWYWPWQHSRRATLYGAWAALQVEIEALDKLTTPPSPDTGE